MHKVPSDFKNSMWFLPGAYQYPSTVCLGYGRKNNEVEKTRDGRTSTLRAQLVLSHRRLFLPSFEMVSYKVRTVHTSYNSPPSTAVIRCLWKCNTEVPRLYYVFQQQLEVYWIAYPTMQFLFRLSLCFAGCTYICRREKGLRCPSVNKNYRTHQKMNIFLYTMKKMKLDFYCYDHCIETEDQNQRVVSYI